MSKRFIRFSFKLHITGHNPMCYIVFWELSIYNFFTGEQKVFLKSIKKLPKKLKD